MLFIFSAFIFSYDTIHVSGTIHTWNRDLTEEWVSNERENINKLVIIDPKVINSNSSPPNNPINYQSTWAKKTKLSLATSAITVAKKKKSAL